MYVIFGGYMATAINDFIQGIIMLFGICAVTGAVLMDNGGLLNATRTLASVTGDAGGRVRTQHFSDRIRWHFFL